MLLAVYFAGLLGIVANGFCIACFFLYFYDPQLLVLSWWNHSFCCCINWPLGPLLHENIKIHENTTWIYMMFYYCLVLFPFFCGVSGNHHWPGQLSDDWGPLRWCTPRISPLLGKLEATGDDVDVWIFCVKFLWFKHLKGQDWSRFHVFFLDEKR